MPLVTPRLRMLPFALALSVMSVLSAQSPWDDEELRELQPKAEAGDVDAMSALAERYRWLGADDLAEEGWMRALPWLEKAALKGHGYAASVLAHHYREPRVGEPDLGKAFQWMERSAKAGHGPGQFGLAEMYERGLGVEVSMKDAARWYEKAALQYDSEAQLRIGQMYADGNGVPKDVIQAVTWFKKAAEDTDEGWRALDALKEANPDLADKLITVAPDETQSLMKRAQEGDVEAQKEIANLFSSGSGGFLVDDRKAFEWWRKAAERGDGVAQLTLGTLYLDGPGVERNDVEATKWLEKAVANGQPDACVNLGNIALERPNDGGWGPAIAVWRKGAEAGSKASMEKLAEGYVAQGQNSGDYGDAILWYTKLAETGDARFMNLLAMVAMTDNPKVKNFSLARKWLNTAVEQGDADAKYYLDILNKREAAAKLVAAAPTPAPTAAPTPAPDFFALAVAKFEADVSSAKDANGRSAAVRNFSWAVDAAGKPAGWSKTQKSEKVFGALVPHLRSRLGEAGDLVFAVADPTFEQGAYERVVPADIRAAVTSYAQKVTQDFNAKQAALGPIQRLIPLADAGDSNAAYQIGDYLLKEHAAKDEAGAIRRLQQAINLGHVQAKHRLAYVAQSIAQRGQQAYANKDLASAFSLFSQSANLGDSGGMMMLGAFYADGIGVAKDEATGKEWLEKSLAAGNPGAQKVLAAINARSSDSPENQFQSGLKMYQENNYQGARDAWIKAADAGLGGAMFNLGVLHEKGQGVERDLSTALEWYRKSVAHGQTDGAKAVQRVEPLLHYNAGSRAESENRFADARVSYEKAAALGDTASMMRMGHLFEHGKGSAVDIPQAVVWYEKAAAAGWEHGTRFAATARARQLGLNELKKAHEAIDVMELEEGVKWLTLAAEQGNPTAMYELATMLKDGDGVRRDIEGAKKWLTKAADMGDVGAELDLSSLEASGSLYGLMDSQGEMRRLRNEIDGVANAEYGQNIKGPKSGVKNLKKGSPWNHTEIHQALKEGADHTYLAAVLRREKATGLTSLNLKRLMRTPEGQRVDPYGKLRTELGEQSVQGAGDFALVLAKEAIAKRRAELGPVPEPEDTQDLRAKVAAGDIGAIMTLYVMPEDKLKLGLRPEWNREQLAGKIREAKYAPGYWFLADTLRYNVDKTKDDPAGRAELLFAGAEAGEPKAMLALAYALGNITYEGVARNIMDAEYWLIEAGARMHADEPVAEFLNHPRDIAFLYSFGVPMGGATMYPMSYADPAVLRWAREMIRRGGDLAEVAEVSLDSLEQDGDRKNLRAELATLPAEVPWWTAVELRRLEEAAAKGDAGAAEKLGVAYASGRGTRQNDFKAVRYHEMAAAKGSVTSMRALAEAARTGFGMTKDAAVRLAWLEKAGEAGDVAALRDAGDMLHYVTNENTLPKDYPRAMAAYEKAAARGDGMAMHSIALMHEYGRGVEKSDENALQWLRKGAEAGNLYSQENYARKMMEAKKFAEAAEWYGKAADAGRDSARMNEAEAHNKAGDLAKARVAFEKVVARNPKVLNAQMALGYIYEESKEYEKAKASYGVVAGNSSLMNSWRQDAEVRLKAVNAILTPKRDPLAELKAKADAGDTKAMISYAQAIAKDRKAEAIEWVTQAANKGDSQAMLILGLELLPTQKEVGVDWIARSANAGNAEAKYRLGVAMFMGTDLPKDVGAGLRHLQEAADAGFAPAQFDLGRSMIVPTPGIQNDVMQGSKYVRMAADQGLPAAAALLGEMYERGVGVPVNAGNALSWYKKALSAGVQQVKPAVERLQIQLSGKTPPSPLPKK